MKKYLFLILGLLVSLSVSASDWKPHFSYEKDILGIERIDNLVYAISDGKLFSYNPLTEDYNKCQKENNNDSIVKIAYDLESKRLLILRDHFIFDIFDGTNYQNIPAFTHTNLLTDDAINDVHLSGSKAFVSTNFGLIVINIEKAEIQDVCIFQFPIYSISKHDGYLYAATSKGVFRIQADKYLQNFEEWESFPFDEKYEGEEWAAFRDEQIKKIAVLNNQLCFLVPGNSLFHLEGNKVKRNAELTIFPNNLEVKGDNGFVFGDSRLFVYKKGSLTPSSINVWGVKTVTSTSSDDEYWVGISGINLAKIKQKGEDSDIVEAFLKPQGPLSNYPFFMAYTGGKIRLVGGGYLGNNFNNPTQLSELDSNGWYNYTVLGGIRDFVSVQANPSDPDNLLVASWGKGVHEFKDRSFEGAYASGNSSLTDIFGGNDYVRVDGIKFEGPDKFWICNSLVPKVMSLFEKKNGEWKSYALDYPEIYTPFDGNRPTVFRDVFIDKNKNKWVVGSGTPTVFVFNENGTIENISDDKRKLFLKFYDQEGNRLIMNNLYRIAEDKDGHIWIASSTGLFIINNPNTIFDEDIVLRRIEFAQKGNYGSKDYELGRVSTNDLMFDGANRKWVATEENGVYVINGRNTEILAHFTKENSPLPTNRILSITIDENNHVFVGTDKGILEFTGVLPTDPSSKEAVYAYPNPMTKSFLRNVVVKGLKKESSCKIVDANNDLITNGIVSAEGEFEWNGDDQKGKKVEPAVYYVVGIDANGVEGILCEIKVIN